MAYFRSRKVRGNFIRRSSIFVRAYLSLSTNASHEDEIVSFLPQGITSTASKPEMFENKQTGGGGLILLLQHAAF